LEDVADSVASVLRHRLILNYEAEADGVDADAVLKELVRSVPMRTGGVV
jgi:MoxR-like ATPase